MRQKSLVPNHLAATKCLFTGVALGALALSQTAHAQSSVSLFGVVDAAVSRVSGSDRGSRLGLSSGSSSGSRLGFRGKEDLGGGLAAGFWLEGSLGIDTGTAGGLTFNRRSTVSLSGNWGELRLGRDYAPTYWSTTRFDPFNRVGVATNQGVNNFGVATVQNNNTIGYLLPKLGGWYGQGQYGFGEKTSGTPNSRQGDYLGARVGYASGPLDVAIAAGRYRQVIGASDVAPVAIGRSLDVSNLAASWDFGVVKPILFLGRERVPGAAAGSSQLDTYMAALTAPLGAGELRASLARYDRKDSPDDFTKLGIGYGYTLSKRTEVYANLAYLKNHGASAESLASTGLTRTGSRQGGSSNGFDLGIRHNF